MGRAIAQNTYFCATRRRFPKSRLKELLEVENASGGAFDMTRCSVIWLHKKGFASLAIAFTFDPEVKASRQQVRLLTTALLEEVRASTSVGGGGREKAEPTGNVRSESRRLERSGVVTKLGTSSGRYAKGSPIPRAFRVGIPERRSKGGQKG